MGERTIAVVTGTRAEYGLLRGSMAEIERRETLHLATIVTGMHLSPQYGNTITEIRDDGFEITRTVEMLVDSDTTAGMVKSLGLGMTGFADALSGVDPDIVLVLGDRIEAFAAGVAAAHMNVPVAHVHGGEALTGATIDDSLRHALTKFAHIHFPATEQSKERILGLGEPEWRVTVVGAPGLDRIRNEAYTPPEAIREDLGFDTDRPLALVVQHPVTTQPERAGTQMRQTLDAISDLDTQVALIEPNADAGGKRIADVIDATGSDSVRTFTSLPRRKYLGLLATADVLVGNSSSGIIEAPSVGTPVVDIGPRQDGRERAENVTSVPHDTGEIADAVASALHDDSVQASADSCSNPYDHGSVADHLVTRLESVTLDSSLLRKQMTY